MQKKIKNRTIESLEANIGQIDGIPSNPRFIRDDNFLQLRRSVLTFPNMLAIDTIAYVGDGVILGGNQRHGVLTDIKSMSIEEISNYLNADPDFQFKTEENRSQIIEYWRKFLKSGEVPAQDISDLSLEEKLEFVFKDNRSYGETDWKVIEDEWSENMERIESWSGEELFKPDENPEEKPERQLKLSDRFIVPPFSVLDTKQGIWQDRKRFWNSLGIKSEIGRGEDLTNTSLTPSNYTEKKKLEKDLGRKLTVKEYKLMSNNVIISGTSIFDPVVCELSYKWFCPPAGSVIDPFAGGSVRGIVANYLDYKYTGIDIRPEQVASNLEQGDEILAEKTPEWIAGDSNKKLDEINKAIESGDRPKFDFIFSCPPYGDLETYSDLDGDISTLSYPEFIKVYRDIIRKSVESLNEDRFATFVVGDFRDKNGFYNNFVSDTISAFRDAGMELWNEMILYLVGGSIATRARRPFVKNRKVAKQHQNILVFYKGDPEKIRENYPEIDLSYIDEVIMGSDEESDDEFFDEK